MTVSAPSRAGSIRRIAAFLSEYRPDVAALDGIASGDALSLATTTARHWAYRGREALLWNERFAAGRVDDGYLPPAPALVRRRGFLAVSGNLDMVGCTIAATHFHDARAQRIPQLRFVRTRLRSCERHAIFFARIPEGTSVADLGFAASAGAPAVWTRGLEGTQVRALQFKV